MRTCTLNGKSDCEPAYKEGFKSSDIKKLGADAKILVALMKLQPQKRVELCRNAGIHTSTFSRYKRLLEGIIKETPDGFCLWNYTKPTSMWELLQIKLNDAGGPLIELNIEILELGERDKITGWYKKLYDKILPIKGVMILKGAKELEVAGSVQVPPTYLGLLLTDGAIEAGDRFSWRNNLYVIQEVEKIIDGYEVGYRVAKLVVRYRPIA